ncbi:MAG: phosphoenolpyruvate carboxylase [Cloacibacterium normanense]
MNFGSWVGGDRWSSFVTPAVTKETLLLHRKAALTLIKEDLIHLAKKISISAVSNPVPFQLSEMIQEKVSALGEMGKSSRKKSL